MDDDQEAAMAYAMLCDSYPRTVGGLGPSTGAAGEVSDALRAYARYVLADLEAEDAGDLAMGLALTHSEHLLTWVAEQVEPLDDERAHHLRRLHGPGRRPSGGRQ